MISFDTAKMKFSNRRAVAYTKPLRVVYRNWVRERERESAQHNGKRAAD
jgi:hypothetical protein